MNKEGINLDDSQRRGRNKVKKVSIAIAALMLTAFLALPAQGEENKDLWSLSTFVQSAKIQYMHVYVPGGKRRSDLYVAIDMMRDASRRYPHVPEVYFMLGTFFAEINALDTMVAYFDSVETSCADQSVDPKYRTQCYKSKEGFIAKIAKFRQKYWEESFNDGVNILSQYDTVVARKKGAPEDSIQIYDSLKAATFNLAKSDFEQSLMVRPKDSSAVRSYTALGVLYQRDERYLDAIEAYKSCMKISGENAEMIGRVADAYNILEDWKNAIIWYERYLDYMPKDLNALLPISVAYSRINDYEKWYEYTERALQVDSTNIPVLFNAGQYWFLKMQESIAAMSDVSDSTPNADAKRKELETEAAGLRDKAAGYFEKIIAINSQDADALRRLGLLYLFGQKSQDAADVFERYLAINPNDASVLDYLGQAYIKMQNFDKAIVPYETIIKSDPGNVDVWERLEDLYRYTNQADKADKAAATIEELKKM